MLYFWATLPALELLLSFQSSKNCLCMYVCAHAEAREEQWCPPLLLSVFKAKIFLNHGSNSFFFVTYSQISSRNKVSAFVSCRAQVRSLQEILKIISTHPADYLVYMTISKRNRGTVKNWPCANTGSRRIHAGDWLSIWGMSIYPGSGNFDQYTRGCGGDTGKLDLSRQSFREERCSWWDQMMGGSEWTQRVCYIWGKCTTWECIWLKMGRSSMWRAEVRDSLYLSCLVVCFVLETVTLYEITHFT